MAYQYKYITSSSPVFTNPPSQTWQSDFQYLINDSFFSAPDAFIIQEESVFGSGSLIDVDVRINRAINVYTGQKLGDDFKLILFRDLQHSVDMGQKFYFNNNYWLTVNTERIKNFAASCVVRRCNNNLRWVDEYGQYYSEPCAIGYAISRPRDEEGANNPVTPAGYIEVLAQLNDKTKRIKGNQRFLFGSVTNRIAYKVFGDGVRNFLNQETNDDESAKLLSLIMGGNYVNPETDDITNGIADKNKSIFLLSFVPTSISGNPTDSFQITPNLTLNGNNIIEDLSYLTSSSSIAIASGDSGSGLVTLVSSGSCNITVRMTNNTSASAIISVVVSGSVVSDYEVRISPNPYIVYQDDTTTFSAYLYRDGSVQADTFSFALADHNVPEDRYTFTIINGNSFSVKNNLVYFEYPLSITCTSGSYARTVDIELKGAY